VGIFAAWAFIQNAPEPVAANLPLWHSASSIPGSTVRHLFAGGAEFAVREKVGDGFGEYGSRVLGSALAMCDFLLTEDIKGKRLLELGAGTAVVSLCAAQQGAHVLATDYLDEVLTIAADNAHRNSVAGSIEVKRLNWNLPNTQPEGWLQGPWDIILASDVINNKIAHLPLLRKIRSFQEQGRARVLIAYAAAASGASGISPEDPATPGLRVILAQVSAFLDSARSLGYEVLTRTKLPEHSGAVHQHLPRSHNIHVIELNMQEDDEFH